MRRHLLAAVLAALVFAPVGQAWTWPASGAVLQPFLFDPAHPYAAGQHRGIDIGGEPGATVLAPTAGRVTFAGTVPSSGKSVTITTADGYAVTLTHLGSVAVARDAVVAEGAGVGTIGTSGDPEVPQPYVHLGVRIAAEAQGYLDPLTLLPARIPAPAALVPPVVVTEPPPAPLPVTEPVPAPVADPEPVAVAVATPEAPAAAPTATVAVPDAAASEAVEPVEPVAPEQVASPAEPLPAEPEPAALPALDPARSAVVAPAAPASKPGVSPGAPPANEDKPVHGAASVPAPRATEVAGAVADDGAAANDAARHGGRASAAPLAQRARVARVARVAPIVDRAAADARGRVRGARPAGRGPATAPAPAAAGVSTAAIAQRPKPRPDGMLLPLLAAGTFLAAAVLTAALGTVRMMRRCGTDTKEDPGCSSVAVCGGPPSPRSRGGLRRPVGRVRPLSPAERQRRPHGEWHRRARHAGDGGRRQGGQVLR
jgi:hypothetical protein